MFKGEPEEDACMGLRVCLFPVLFVNEWQPSFVEVCKDIEKENLCIEWKDAGYCKATSVFYTYMKRECQKACGFCKVEGKCETPSVLLSPCELFVINDCLCPCYQAHRISFLYDQ